ncbi:MAG: endonuclease/exonuclease/phosphatase family protein [Pseudomonadota bacterium]
MGAAAADPIRIATYHTELSRKGPGLLLRDIVRGEDAQIAAVIAVIAEVKPDILVLQGIDYDHDLRALMALRNALDEAGILYPYMFARAPNIGVPSGADFDGDGRLGEPEDAHSYGWYAGEGGQAILSRFAVLHDAAQDFADMLWADMPSPLWPAEPMPGQEVQRLSRAGHWIVPIDVGGVPLRLMSFHATTPVFDGPEDRNGRRNHDEILFWRYYLDGVFGDVQDGPFVIAGNANLDPIDGEGRTIAIRDLLGDARLQDPEPRSERAEVTAGHEGDPRLDTVTWRGVGSLRVSYVLPSADLRVVDAGIHWPQDGEAAAVADAASRHRLVWVDIELD